MRAPPSNPSPREPGSAAEAMAAGSLPASTTGQEDAGAAPPATAAAATTFGALFSAVMLPMFLAAVDQTLLATATPRIATELGGLGDTSWIAVGYLLAATVTAPLHGRLGDRFGRRNAMLGALAVFVAGSIACALAPSMPLLIGARVLQGLGGGGLMVLSQSLIGELVPPWERPRYQGWFAALFSTSSVGGPLLGGVVVNHGDWRWLFLASTVLSLFAVWRVWQLPRPAPSQRRHDPYDPAGFLLFVACAVSALVWMGQVGQRFPLLSVTSVALLGAAVVAGTLLWQQQRRHPHPFLPLDILRLPQVGWVCLSVLAFAGTLFALVFLLPIYLQVARGADAVGAGAQLLPLTGGIVLGSVINGRVSARTGHSGYLPPIGLAIASLALLALALLPPGTAVITTAAALCGVGFGTVMPSAQMATQILAGRERLGAAAALLSLTRSTGASVGTAAFGGLAFALLQAGHGGLRVEALDPARVTHVFHLVFGALALYAGLGALAAWRAPRIDLRAAAQA